MKAVSTTAVCKKIGKVAFTRRGRPRRVVDPGDLPEGGPPLRANHSSEPTKTPRSGQGRVLVSLDSVGVRRSSRRLLDDISLDVLRGEVLALVGANGAGKSTMLGVVAGDIAPDIGTVTLRGRSIDSMTPEELARVRSVLPQQTLLQFGFRGRDVVEMGRSPLAPERRQHDAYAVEQAMASTESRHLGERRYPTLSGGEQMRVSLARVLAQESPLLLLDEPTASLDVRHQHLVMEVAQAFAAEGATVVCILHDLNLALAYADRIAVLAQGQLVAAGAPWEIAEGDLLEQAFACPMTVMPHPHRPAPMVLTLGAGTGSCFLRHLDLPSNW